MASLQIFNCFYVSLRVYCGFYVPRLESYEQPLRQNVAAFVQGFI
jgi:hypothetical protein